MDDGPQVWVVNDDYSQSTANAVTVIEKVADPLPDATAIDYAQERYRLLELSDPLDDSQPNVSRNNSTDSVDASENEIDSDLPDEVSEVYNEQATETPLVLRFHPNMSRDEIRATQGQVMARFMDWTVDPCADFYEFACGNWDLHNTMPDDAAGFDTFEKLRDQLHLELRQLLQDPPGQADSKAVVKAKHLYASCMDLGKFSDECFEKLSLVFTYLIWLSEFCLESSCSSTVFDPFQRTETLFSVKSNRASPSAYIFVNERSSRGARTHSIVVARIGH